MLFRSPAYPAYPIMRFNYEKELEEYRNLIIQLVASSFNVNIKIELLKLNPIEIQILYWTCCVIIWHLYS